ncbi:hypothetical protein JL09_g4947 [Pichia kudriavzevii]|uniref:Uncharacterized protein n=1 Tax=Pichia kudriavzevii TaxID=4909 RepID=A0A099NSY8_PICKU|nr:hypothetical protein JL09_g4947 [Pichia kudriavzevii]
MLTDYNPNAP